MKTRWYLIMPFAFVFGFILIMPLLMRFAMWWFDFVLCGSVARCP